jgi:hypothetical protein
MRRIGNQGNRVNLNVTIVAPSESMEFEVILSMEFQDDGESPDRISRTDGIRIRSISGSFQGFA